MSLPTRWWVGLAAAVWAAAGIAGAGPVEDGQAALERGDVNTAYESFMTAFREDPLSEAANFGLGLASFAKGRYAHAAFAFERVLARNPGNQRARLELGRAYRMMRLPDLARSQFELVLSTQPPAAVQDNIRLQLREIDASERRWSFNGELRLSGFYDDNVNYGPSSLRVDTTLGPLEVAPDSQPQSAWGIAGTFGGSAVYDIGEPRGWLATGGLYLYDSALEGADDYNLAFGRVLAGLRHVQGRRTIDLPLKADGYGLGGDSLLTAYGADPTWAVDTADVWGSVTRATGEYRDYDDDAQDAGYGRLTQLVSKRFGAYGRHQVSAMASGFFEDAKEKPHDNAGWELGASAEAGLPWGLTAYAIGLYRHARYGAIQYPALQPETREDDQFQAGGGLRRRVGRSIELDLGFRHIWNRSTFDLYEYDRNITTLSTAWLF